MELALPGDAMRPGRNIGLLAHRTVLDDRMTCSLGAFVNTGSLKNAGEAKNRLEDRDGYNLTARITGTPWYQPPGDRLLHLGLSLTRQVRDEADQDVDIRFRARPETRLTDTRLVDTGNLRARRNDMINAELALVLNTLSLQGELYHALVDTLERANPRFWGFYLYGSCFFTGEHRSYEPSRGLFTRVAPRQPLNLRRRTFGAWELALRFSHVDLNDGEIRGGTQSNWNLGLNWYLTPHVRIMFSAVHGRVKDRETAPAIDSGGIDVLQARFQIAY
jgi:phosphate-selective porin OprO/OprP